MIYFDNSATTFPKPEEVYKALDHANRKLAFNAGRGAYKQGADVQKMIDETRKLVSGLVETSENNVVFLSSATEALNMIINGIEFKDGDNIYISPFEHNAIIRPLYALQEKVKININILPFDKKTWAINITTLANQFAIKKPKVVFLSHISNVTGYILPYESIFKLSKQYESINVLDSAQSLGIINPKKSTIIDFIVFAGHKSLYASFGIAGFINLSQFDLLISKSGGTGSDSLNHFMPEHSPNRYESGSMNSVAIAGLNASLKWLKNQNIYEHEKKLTDYLIARLIEIENVRLYLPNDYANIVGIISLNIDDYKPDEVGRILSDEFDICVRVGYHCAPLVHEFLNTIETEGTVRISLGAFNTAEEIDMFIQAIRSL